MVGGIASEFAVGVSTRGVALSVLVSAETGDAVEAAGSVDEATAGDGVCSAGVGVCSRRARSGSTPSKVKVRSRPSRPSLSAKAAE